MSETEILQRVDPALVTLLEAYRYAQAAGRDPWDFAVEIDDLRDAGITDSDLRYLICAGFAEHATEVTRPAWRKRVFRKLHNLGMTNKTCLVLTERGESFAQQTGVSVARSGQLRNGGNTDNVADKAHPQTAVPIWDRFRRELRVGDLVVKGFRMPAPCQETILVAFEEEGWPVRIDDPLPPLGDQDPKKRLHDAINKLNRHQKQRLLRFRGDGTGRGICWELELIDTEVTDAGVKDLQKSLPKAKIVY
ncbi:MAG: hypothetical protein HY000_40815 [Planctomycetes bacterium]|nr:hypothetical protein [Planctomycetota bacterium]